MGWVPNLNYDLIWHFFGYGNNDNLYNIKGAWVMAASYINVFELDTNSDRKHEDYYVNKLDRTHLSS